MAIDNEAVIPELEGVVEEFFGVDKTLTKSGYSADAKAVGDKFRNEQRAVNFSYNNNGNGLEAETIQEALDELKNITDETDRVIDTMKKPTGTYEGNGSATTRTIHVGGTGGWLGVCSGSYIIGIITQNGAMFFNTTNSAVKCFPVSQAKYMSGNLTISSADDLLNKKDSAYHYQVL